MKVLLLGFIVIALTGVIIAAEPRKDVIPSVTIEGVVYEDIRFGRVMPPTVTIYHKRGVANVPLASLPPELQKTLGYDKIKAEAERAAAEQAKIVAEVHSTPSTTICTALAADLTNTNLLAKLKLKADTTQSPTTRAQLLTIYYLGKLCTSAGAEAQTAWNSLQVINPSAFANLFDTCATCGGKGTVETDCPGCRGIGNCPICDGYGWVQFSWSLWDRYRICQHCKGTKLCPVCKGQKTQSVHCRQCTNGRQFSRQKLQQTYWQLVTEACNQ